jgi:hypothetical protein
VFDFARIDIGDLLGQPGNLSYLLGHLFNVTLTTALFTLWKEQASLQGPYGMRGLSRC